MTANNDNRTTGALYNIGAIVGESNLIGMVTATNHFNSFLVFLMGEEPSTIWPVRYCPVDVPADFYSKDLIGKFACYLVHEKEVKSLETALSYVSKLKGRLTLDYGAEKLPFLDDSNTFWAKLRANLKRLYLAKCNLSGERLVKSAPPMTKADLKVILHLLLELNTSSSNEERCIICLQYQVVGRISEPSAVTKKDIKFVDQDNRTVLMINITRKKSADMQSLCMIPHYDSYVVCPLHCLATLIVSNGDPSINLYPILTRGKSPSSYMNRVLAKCYMRWCEKQQIQDEDDV